MQVPAQVEYEKAASLEDALALLARYQPGARILAGGHSLIPMMKLRLAQPEVLIDVNGIRGLRYIDRVGGELRIGADLERNVRHQTGARMERATPSPGRWACRSPRKSNTRRPPA